MADFEFTQIPELVAQRLDAVAADAQTQGQQMFAKALEDQRKLLGELATPASSLLTGTATFAQRLASPPPRPTRPPAAPSGDETPAASEGASASDPSPRT